MANNAAASMTASIVIDKNDIITQALQELSKAQKELNNNKLEIYFDISDVEITKKLKDLQTELDSKDYVIKVENQGIEETFKSLSELLSLVKDIASGKTINIGNGKSLVDSSATVSEIDKITKATKELENTQQNLNNSLSKSYETKNKTEAYNQLKQMADVFKNFYGNEEAMHTKSGTEAAYAYYKAYEEALRKGVAESKLKRVTIDIDPNDSIFTADKLVYDRTNQYYNQLHYGYTSDLSENLTTLESRLFKFNEAYTKVKTNLGEAPITSEIIKNIEEYVRYLEIAEARERDTSLGLTKDDITGMRDIANMHLGFAMDDAIEENKKYVSSLKEIKEEKEQVNETISNSSPASSIDDSKFEELKSDITEVRQELDGVKEKISGIDSEGFEKIKSDVEKTTESVKELNSELSELKSQISDTSTADKSNISSGNELEIIDSEELIILDDVIEKEEKVIETTKEMYRAFNSSHGVSGKNGISWFASNLSDATSYLDIGNTNKDSVAKLIADTSKFLTVDAKGAQWGEILYEGIERTTDEIAEMAKQAGYVGVEFKNIQDSYNGISDNGNSVFAIFDDNLLKSITDYTETARKKVSEINEITSYVDDKLYENFNGSSVSIFENVRKQFDSVIDLVKDGTFDIETAFTEVDNIVERFKKNPIEDVFQGDAEDKSIESLKARIKEIFTDADDLRQVLKSLEDGSSFDLSWVKDSVNTDNEAKVQSLIKVLKEYGYTIKDLKNDSDGWFTSGSIVSLTDENNVLDKTSVSAKEASESKEKFAKANKEVKASADSSKTSISEEEKYFNSLGNSIEKYDNTLTAISRKPADGNRSNELQEKIDVISASIKELRTLESNAKKDGYVFNKEDVKRGQELEKIIKDKIELVKQMSAAQKGSDEASRTKEIDKLTKYLDQNTRISKEARKQLEGYLALLKSGDPSVNVKDIHTAWTKVAVAEREAGREGKSFLDIFKDKKLYSFIGQMASMFSFYDIIRYTREGISALKEFDDGLTKISYTMDMTKSQFNDLGQSVLDMASDMKTSLNDAISVAQIYANMNTTAEEIQRLSEPTLILSNLTGFDASTVADDIQAVTQQFDILAEDSMHIADVYDYISRNIAVDYSKGIEAIAEAVQVAGSTAKQAGLEYEQLAAIVGKTAEKTRLEGSQIGNGLKTIMTRLSKVGELSDEVDNETMSDASESLHKIGVEVYNADGSFRQFDVIMGELANKWSDLSDAEKSNISFAIAATRQTNLLSAVLSNFSDSMQLAEGATNANGSALENQQKYMDSFAGHLQSLETEAKIAWINILDSETLKSGVDLLTGLVKVVGQLVDKFGLLGSAGLIGGGILGAKNIGRPKMFGLIV